MRHFLTSIVLSGGLALSWTHAHGEELQSLQMITDAARDFVTQAADTNNEGKLVVDMGGLDPRLRLAACAQPLEAFMAPGSQGIGAGTVGVRCLGLKPWKVFIPFRTKFMVDVVTANHPIPRGHIIEASDLGTEAHDISRLTSGYYKDPAELVGLLAKRPIGHNKVVTPNTVEQQDLVKRGEAVLIAAAQGALKIRMQGIALSNGAEGETIRVKNNSSQRIIEAIVVGPGRVEVGL